MLFTFTTLALALVGAAQANPVARETETTPTGSVDQISSAQGLPVVSLDLGTVSEHGKVTVGPSGVNASSTDAIYPATIYVCRALGCGSCTGYDLSIQDHNVCYGPGFSFVSSYIHQPSNEGLPYGVFTGPGCGSWAQLPAVNTCYNNVNFIGNVFELSP